MGTAYIEEYASVGKDIDGNVVPVEGRLLNVQTVTTSGTTARISTALHEDTHFITISSDTAECFELGDSTVEATTSDRPLYASTYRSLEVRPMDDNAELDYTANPTHIAFINK